MNDLYAELQRHAQQIARCKERIRLFEQHQATLLRERLEARFPWLLQEDGSLPHSFSEDVTKLRALHEELKEDESRARIR